MEDLETACLFCGETYRDPTETVCLNPECCVGRYNLDLERADEICHALRDDGPEADR